MDDMIFTGSFLEVLAENADVKASEMDGSLFKQADGTIDASERVELAGQ